MQAKGPVQDVNIQLEINAGVNAGVIESLLAAGALCLSDLRPLNSASKQVLRPVSVELCEQAAL